MFEPIWRGVTGMVHRSQTAQVTGFQRWLVRGSDFPGVVETGDPSHVLSGKVYLDLGADCLASLDRYEDAFYVRTPTIVTTVEERSQIDADIFLVLSEVADEILEIGTTWLPEVFSQDQIERYL